MSPEEKQRMIHIRIGKGIHKDLRKVAAEYDLTIQDLVADAVEDRIEDLEMEAKLEQRRERLERKAREVESRLLEKAERVFQEQEEKLKEEEIRLSMTAELDEDDFSKDLPEAVMAKLLKLEKDIEKISFRLDELVSFMNTDE